MRTLLISGIVVTAAAAAALGAGCNGSNGPSSRRATVVAPPSAQALDIYTGFTAHTKGLNTLAFAPTPNATIAYAFEDSGTIQVLDIAASPVQRVGQITIDFFDETSSFATAMAISTTAGAACSSAFGPGKVYLFDPDPAAGRLALDDVDLSTLALPTAGAPNGLDSNGTPVASVTPGFAASDGLVFHGNRLFVATSNFGPFGQPTKPGTVLAFDLVPTDPTTFQSPTPTAIFTRHFNPNGLRLARTPGGKEVLLATCGSAFGGALASATVSAVEVIDPVALTVTAVFPLGGAGLQRGAVQVGAVAFVGGQSQSGTSGSLYRISLRNVDAALATPGTIEDLSADVLNGPAAPIAVPLADPASAHFFDFVSDIEPSADGARLHVVQFNDSTLTTYDVATATVVGQARFSRGKDTAATGGPNASVVAVRPGRPGVDFTGPDLFIGTVNLSDPADRKTPNVQVALDALRSY